MNLRRKGSFRQVCRAFSLVELTVAIGITAFGGITMMGMLSVGVSHFRTAVDMSVGSQIVQRVAADVQQASFSTLQQGTAPSTSDAAMLMPVRYFDDQGTELSSGTTSTAGAVVYRVAVGVKVNGSGNLATVVVDILNDPGKQVVARDTETGGFASGPMTILAPTRYSFHVSRTQ